MSDLISRQSAIDAVGTNTWAGFRIKKLPTVDPEIIRCKDCKFYIPMNRETKSGICSLLIHQNFGDDWYCAGVERRTDEAD